MYVLYSVLFHIHSVKNHQNKKNVEYQCLNSVWCSIKDSLVHTENDWKRVHFTVLTPNIHFFVFESKDRARYRYHAQTQPLDWQRNFHQTVLEPYIIFLTCKCCLYSDHIAPEADKQFNRFSDIRKSYLRSIFFKWKTGFQVCIFFVSFFYITYL